MQEARLKNDLSCGSMSMTSWKDQAAVTEGSSVTVGPGGGSTRERLGDALLCAPIVVVVTCVKQNDTPTFKRSVLHRFV